MVPFLQLIIEVFLIPFQMVYNLMYLLRTETHNGITKLGNLTWDPMGKGEVFNETLSSHRLFS